MKLALPKPDDNPGSRPQPRPPSGPRQTPPVRAVRVGDSSKQNRLIVLLLVLGAAAGLLVECWPQVKQGARDAMQALQARIETPTTAPAPLPAPPTPGLVAAERSEGTTTPDAAVTAVPDTGARLAPILSMLAGGPLREIAGVSSEAMQVALTPAGDVLMTSKYAVFELGAGDSPLRRLLFNPRLYREQFTDARAQAMASALLLADGRYVLGGWHGEVLMGHDGRLQRLSAREQRPKGRIAHLLNWNSTVLLAGDGFWRMQDDAWGLQEIPLPGASRLDTVGVGAQELLIADSGKRIFAWDGRNASLWLQWPDDAGQIERLVPAREGGWWVGTTRGLYRVGDDRQLQRMLADVWVTDIVEYADESWVGTWKQGLLLSRAGRWYRLGAGAGGLADDSVSALVVDARDHLWLALYGGGGWRAERSSLRERIMQRPWVPEADPAD